MAAGAATVAWGLVLAASTTRAAPALATVVHHQGFEATVLGWTSWYGDYDLGPIGDGWCIDHGLSAPDASFGYRPTTPTDLRDDTRAAMAWAVTSAGPGADPVRAAALMLVLHDLRGAEYPYGRLDVNTLGTAQLAGFAGREGQVIAEAQAIKADALAHAARRGPLRLSVATQGTGPTSGLVVVSLTDGRGAPVSGASVSLASTGATLGLASATTGPDGRLSAPYALPAGWATGDDVTPAHFDARAVVPDPTLSAWASSTVPAQRIVTPSWLTLTAAADLAPPPTTTTTTAQPTTSTTRSPITTTTTTRPRPTTTTVPTTTVPTTTVPTTTVLDDHHRVEPGPGHRRAPQRPATHQPHPGARDQRGDPSTPGDRRLQPGLGHGGPGAAPDGLGAGGGGPRTEPPGVVGRLPRACLTMAAGHR